MIGSPTVWVFVSIFLLTVKQIRIHQNLHNGVVTFLDITTVEFGVCSFKEGTIHTHCMLCGEADFHPEIVIILTIHDRGMNHTSSICSRDPVRL